MSSLEQTYCQSVQQIKSSSFLSTQQTPRSSANPIFQFILGKHSFFEVFSAVCGDADHHTSSQPKFADPEPFSIIKFLKSLFGSRERVELKNHPFSHLTRRCFKVEMRVGFSSLDSGGICEESRKKGGRRFNWIWKFQQYIFAVVFS